MTFCERSGCPIATPLSTSTLPRRAAETDSIVFLSKCADLAAVYKRRTCTDDGISRFACERAFAAGGWSTSLQPAPGHEIHREGAQPMAAFIMLAGDCIQARLAVHGSRGFQRSLPGVVFRQPA